MKILYVVTGLTTGGAERVVINLANQMSKLGHDVSILVLKDGIEIYPDPDVTLEILKINSFFSLMVSFRRAALFFNKFNPDVLHAHMFHANIYARLLRLIVSVPKLICSLHNNHEVSVFRNYIYKITNFLSDVNTNVSQEAVDSYVKKGVFKKNELITVYNGINLVDFSIDNKSRELYRSEFDVVQKRVFLAVGRLTGQKDYLNLLQAFKILLELNNNVVLYIVGEGEERLRLEKYIFDNNLGEYIKLLGLRQDVPNLMNMADYYVLSSFSEGLPTVLIEAISCGKPVVSTNCGGASEILFSHDFLVERSSPLKLAEKLNSILTYDSLSLLNLCKSNKEYVEYKFSTNTMLSSWLQIYGLKNK